eukprot:5751606-Prymnesium_polylepis.1
MARSPEVADAVPAVRVPSAWPARGRGAAHVKEPVQIGTFRSKSGDRFFQIGTGSKSGRSKSGTA